jgi:prepilin-type N-terminal cleavage/methylation domain-containing protein
MKTGHVTRRPVSGSPAGFNLLEILIVMALIAILTVVAIPLLRRSEAATNEVMTMKAMRSLVDVQMQYHMMYKTYGTLADLGPQGKGYLNDPAMVAGSRNGYRYVVTVDTDRTWHAVATPVTYGSTGTYTYYIDETRALRCADLAKSEIVDRAVGEGWKTVQ